MVNKEEREPRKLKRAHHKILNRVKKLINKSKKGLLVKVLAATIAFSAAAPIKAMEPDTKQHFNKVAEYTVQMQEVVNHQLDFKIDSDQFKQADIVVDSLKNLQTKEVSDALEGYFTDSYVYLLSGDRQDQVKGDIKALRDFAEEVGDSELQKGVVKWTNYMEGALNAKNVAEKKFAGMTSNYESPKTINVLLKQVFKETKDFKVLNGYVSFKTLSVLERWAWQITEDARNERYDDLVEAFDFFQDSFDKVPVKPEKGDVLENLVEETKFNAIKKIMANATHHIESDREEIAIDEINVAKKIDKKIVDYMMPTVLESMTNEIVKTALSGDLRTARKQIKLLDKKFDSKTAVEEVNNKIGGYFLKQAKNNFSKNDYPLSFHNLLVAEDFFGERQKDLRKSMSHILEKKGQTKLAKEFESSTSLPNFRDLIKSPQFWK